MFNFASGKCLRSQRMRRNPRKTAWTQLYRRKHKKGSQEEVSKKRTRRTVKFQRAIQGTTLAEIMMKRNQKPEVRKAQREQAIRCGYVDECSRVEHQPSHGPDLCVCVCVWVVYVLFMCVWFVFVCELCLCVCEWVYLWVCVCVWMCGWFCVYIVVEDSQILWVVLRLHILKCSHSVSLTW